MKRNNFFIYTLVILTSIVTFLLFVANFLLFEDGILLSHRNQFTLKNELKLLNKDNPAGVGGYYIPEQKATPVSYLTYEIKAGDALHTISQKLGVDVVTILNFNDISIPSRIVNGKKIIIPNQDGIVVKVDNNNTIKKIANKYKVDITDLKEINY